MNALFKTLNAPTRRAIRERLRAGPATAGAIAEQFRFSAPPSATTSICYGKPTS